MAALAGVVLSSQIGAGDPNIGVGIGFELHVIGVPSNGLSLAGVAPFWLMSLKGMVLIAAVVVDKRLNEGVLRMSAKSS